VRARKGLGQHWLTDRRILKRVSNAADFSGEDTIIEVGAGTGLLTELLAERARRLIAVEVDPMLARGLCERFVARDNVAVIEADVLASPPEELLAIGGGRMPYVVVGNLPYFIGTAIVRRFLQATAQPRWLVVTLQAEVAESMAAGPGRMTYLAVETQMLAIARVLFHIPPKAFRPPPKVRSAVVRLDVRDAAEIEVDDRNAFLALVRAGFAAPRKQVRNSLTVGLGTSPAESETILLAAGVDPAVRPAALSLQDWRNLYLAFRARRA
jgi:16S rRNA (adenine1518-N6/adenine1519-N6)-dimethyltransferase